MTLLLETTARLWWDIGTGAVTNIVSADGATRTIVVAGDKRRSFLTGALFTVAGTPAGVNDGIKSASADATYDGTNTTIYVGAFVIVSQGAAGTLTEVGKFIDFLFGVKLLPQWSEPGAVVQDRDGTDIFVRKPAAQRRANRVTLLPHTTDALVRANNGDSLAKVVYDNCVLAQKQFTLYHYELNVQGAAQETVKRAYRGRFVNLGANELLGTISHGDGAGPSFPLELLCDNDGTFTNIATTSVSLRW